MAKDVFKAIADPTRRAILGLLAVQSLTLNAVADNFDISRPAVSKHVKILEESGLIHIDQQGRERICHAQIDGLNEISDWLSDYRKLWESKFDALDEYLNSIQNKTENK